MNSRSGFSLISVIVGIALLGLLSMMFMSLFKNSNDMQKHVERGTEYSVMVNSLNLVLSHPGQCAKALVKAGAPVTLPTGTDFSAPVKLDEIAFAGSSIVKAGDRTSSGINITDISLSVQIPGTAGTTNDPLTGTSVPTIRYLGNLSVKGAKSEKSAGARTNYDIPLMPINLDVDSLTGRLVSCTVSANTAQNSSLTIAACEDPDQVMVGITNGVADCVDVDSDSSSGHMLAFSDKGSATDKPVTCSYTQGNATRSLSCNSKTYSCQYLNSAQAVLKGGTSGSGWYYVNNSGLQKINRACTAGITSTDASKEINIASNAMLPSTVNSEDFNTACRNNVGAAGEIPCTSFVTDLTNAAGVPLYTDINKTFTKAPKFQVGLCYRRTSGFQTLWYSVKTVNAKGTSGLERECSQGVRAVATEK